MTEMTKYTPGTFSWTDLATTDAEAAKAFYTELFGLSAHDMPAGPDNVYTMLQKGDKAAAGLYAMNEEQKAQGMPPHWVSYVSVADVNETAGQVKELGGQIIVEPFDVMDSGRMAVLQGPTGETLALWQPKAHIGAQLVNEPGTLTWNELNTTDADKAREFYTRLFGWTTRTDDMGEMTYTSFLNGERMNAGMLQMTEEWGDIPSNWMVYFAVADCDQSVEKVQALGGQSLMPPTDIPGVGRFSVVQDPQGAYFTVIKLENPE